MPYVQSDILTKYNETIDNDIPRLKKLEKKIDNEIFIYETKQKNKNEQKNNIETTSYKFNIHKCIFIGLIFSIICIVTLFMYLIIDFSSLPVLFLPIYLICCATLMIFLIYVVYRK